MKIHSFVGMIMLGLCLPAGAQTVERPYITTREPITILSANDGQSHLRMNARMQRDLENQTRDSITVIHLGPDHPPIVKTVYGTVPNTISGAPYMAMTGDGHYGFVTSRGGSTSPGEPTNLMSVIDLTSPELEVIQTVEVPSPAMVEAHPDGRRIIVPGATGFMVFEMRDGRCVLVRENPTPAPLGSMDISPTGDRIVATMGGRLHAFSYDDGRIEHQAEIGVAAGQPAYSRPFSQRFTPDGRWVMCGNENRSGTLEHLLLIDMSLDPPMVTGHVAQLGDQFESMAVHPSGDFVVVGVLEEIRVEAHLTYSHLAVVDLRAQPPRLLYQMPIEAIPEGIEFTPDGTQLFVGLTAANHIAVFDVEGMTLKKHPMVIRVGHAPASMALGRRFTGGASGR